MEYWIIPRSQNRFRMHFLQFTLHFFMALLLCSGASRVHYNKMKYDVKDEVARTISVDQSGHGNFMKVQQAIDSIPPNNNQWILIHVRAGIYNEKVIIPREKSFIVLEGEGVRTTVIQWGDAGDSIKSSTFTLSADNFLARNIAFKNTYNEITPSVNGKRFTWAPAALIDADKASFYNCSFISLQDTLTDSRGRHYFESCYVEGAVDFIWGSGRSIYQGCILNVTASVLGGSQPGYITAQGRNSTADNGGFVFSACFVVGTGPAYLGRAYGKYSRVLYYKTDITNVIVPEGWFAWEYSGQEDTITYAEVGCTGSGANMAKRVKWEKNLSLEDLHFLTDAASFIDEGGWIQGQPHPLQSPIFLQNILH